MKRLDHVRGSGKVRLVAAVAVLLLLPRPAVGDERAEGSGEPQGGAQVNRELAETRRRLGRVEAVLGDARADALVALESATDEVGRQEARLAEQVRGAYMTGRAKTFWQANGWY